MELAPFIRELILHNECIILPGFGGFETEYTPAAYDSKLKLMLPPSKKITFKPEYLKGGEILEKHISTKLRLKKEQVRTIIENYVASLKIKLAKGEIVSIEGIGVFKLDVSGNITFSQLQEENYLAESFGLEPLPIVETKKQISKPDKNKPAIVIVNRSNTLKMVIAGAVIICILLTVTIVISSKFNLYLFNIGDKTAKSDEIIIGGSSISDTSLSKINQKIEEYTSVKQALSLTPEKKVEEATTITNIYFIIAGSFITYSSAVELETILKSEGYSPTIIKVGTNYKVCLGRYTDKTPAEIEITRIRQQMSRSLELLTVDIK